MKLAIESLAGFGVELRRLLEGTFTITDELECADCVLVAHAPPELDALTKIVQLNSHDGLPAHAIVVVSFVPDPHLVRAALRAGAMVVVERDRLDADRLRAAIDEAVERFSIVGRASEKHRALLESLRRSEELVRTIAENSTQGFAMMDGRGYCTYANKTWLEMTGYTHEEIGSAPLHELVHHHYPDGRPYPMAECPIDRALPENFDVRSHEDLFFRKDGSTFPVLCAASPIFKDGRPISTVIEIRDMTESKRRERRLKRILETNLLGIVSWDIRGALLDANEEFLRIVGYDRADLEAGRINWVQMTPPEYREQDGRVIEELYRTGKHAAIEKEFIRKDGSRIWVLIGSAFTEGHLFGVGFVLDISRQKTTEATCKQSEQLAREAAARAESEQAVLNAILEAAPAGIIVADAQGKLLRVNPANERLWGPAPFSQNIDEYKEWKGWWADHSERHGQRIAPHEWAMSRALRGEAARNDIVEIEPFGRPGTRRTVLNSGAPVRDTEGLVTGAVIVQMDISALVAAESALRDSEARFRTISEALPSLVFVHSADGRNSFVNHAFCEFAGREAQDVLDHRWEDLLHPDDARVAWPIWRKAAATGEPFEAEYRIRRHDGAWRWHIIRTVPQKNADGSIRQWIGTATDITERKQAEEALREADRRKDQFIAILAHELRNPLGPVRNAVEILRRFAPATEPRIARARDVIDRQVTHMARLIDDLLDVSRIARGKLALRKEICDLGAIAQQTAEDYRPNLEAAGLRLVISRDAELWVNGDRVRLAQMIGNLLNNAGRFTERGGRIEVRAEIDATAHSAVVSVIDSGVGIEPALLARLFDPFSQADQDLARSKGGLGLGLALTKGLAELHGGSVSAQSPGLGHGATFSVRIPLSNGPHEAASEKSLQDSQGLRILIVEDNRDAAETLSELLALGGHDVQVAYDGATAITAAKTFKPKVIISDLGLPGAVDGYALARTLGGDAMFADAYFIALSGYANEEARAQSRAAGFHAHLAKPADINTLNRVLADIGKGVKDR